MQQQVMTETDKQRVALEHARGGNSLQFITFTVGDKDYGVDIMAVREIKAWTATTSLPNSPNHMRGVVNLRGVIVPIYDLRARFGMGMTEATESHVIVIVVVGERNLGILVDAVSDILTIEEDDIQSVPDGSIVHDTKSLTGLVTTERGMVALLSLEDLFDLAAFVEGTA